MARVLTSAQIEEVAQAKRVIYEGFLHAVASGIDRDSVGIFVDEQFGDAILQEARAHGYMTACPVEKSGQQEFEFEYGDAFAEHIEKFAPIFAKILVRYNPEGNSMLNRRQATRLRQLSE